MDASRFAGRVAFVTSAASGIGRATAIRFAQEGAAGPTPASEERRTAVQRIPLVDVDGAPEEVQKALQALPVSLNIFRMLAHASTSFRPLIQLGSSILTAQQLDPELREYAILLGVKVYNGRYEWIQHVPIAEACGATKEQIEAIEKGDLRSSIFDVKEQAFLTFVDESARSVRCSDATFAAMKQHFCEREIVETILTIGFYQMLARLTECTDTELDEPKGTRVIDSAIKARRG